MDLKQLLSQTTVQQTTLQQPNVNTSSDVSGGNADVNTSEIVDVSADVSADVNVEMDDKPNSEVFSEVINESEEDKEEKLDPRFTLPWNKLEKGVKMNRILIFIQSQREEHTLTEQQSKELKNLLFKACENGLFNKISDVEYDESKAEIKSIKNLEFNESSKKYKIKTGGTKNRSVSKSRSNIDRLTKKK